MRITLSKQQVDSALPRVGVGLEKYLWLQSRLHTEPPAWEDLNFRRKFNHFYRVRRGVEWQRHFYSLMAQAHSEKIAFPQALELFKAKTNRYEASFISKLIASLDTNQPVIDSIVLKNLSLALPYSGSQNRAQEIVAVHNQLKREFEDFLQTEVGQYLVTMFHQAYPEAHISTAKMVDLVLWQTRA